VLAVSNNFVVGLGINSSLQTLDEVENVLGNVEWVFSWRFLPTTPSWIFEGIDVGGEKIDTSPTKVVEGACFSTDNGRDVFDELVIKRRTKDDGLWE